MVPHAVDIGNIKRKPHNASDNCGRDGRYADAEAARQTDEREPVFILSPSRLYVVRFTTTTVLRPRKENLWIDPPSAPWRPTCLYSLQSSSHSVHTNIGDSHVTAFASNSGFTLVVTGHRRLEVNRTVDRKGDPPPSKGLLSAALVRPHTGKRQDM
jgi:hypothetical protein